MSEIVEQVREECAYCGKPADGAMLCMDSSMAHSDCVIEELNKLLDPDYFGEGEPNRIIAIIDPDAELPSAFTNKGTQKTAIQMREDMKGWVKGVKNE